jgi:hypothetical protein
LATYSTVLGLKLNDQSDPFELSDFTSNYEILDANPGVFICTSVSRPSWGTAQAGRLIFMTDLKQLSYWNGSAWNDPRDAAPVFAGGTVINQGIGASAVKNYSILTINTPRPCALTVWMTGKYSWPSNAWQAAQQNITFDGADQNTGGFTDGFVLPGIPTRPSTAESITVPSMAVIPSVAAGQHTIGAKVQMGGDLTTVTVTGFKVIAMMGVYSSNNVL